MTTQTQQHKDAAHTPEPWRLEQAVNPDAKLIRAGLYTSVAIVEGFIKQEHYEPAKRMPREEVEANAHRIVACVNACQGIPTESLEGGVIKELQGATKELLLLLSGLELEGKLPEIGDGQSKKARAVIFNKAANVLAKLKGRA